ncbi:MAG: glycosyltransferase [Acetobacter sp.]|nr:glycosyltransferase [Bacteroides sp.]MCM1341560.1 glycosyltransferase [Acetobacter sp.]MCM1433637.1 glycosyltransferase [Clostridiales bacterium]
MNELITVIVPVYNAEKFIDRCIISIINQTYKNLEIILVDDGSSDNCPQICDKWAEKDDRIKVIHKKNGGEISARTAGIAEASGKFIGFVDSDDWIEPDMYEYMHSKFEDDIDIVRCCYNRIHEDGTPSYIVGDGADTVVSGEEFLLKMLQDNSLNSNCWCKLYRRSMIPELNISCNIKIGGDHLMNYFIIKRVRNVAICSGAKYNYYYNNSSVTYSDKNLSAWLDNISVHKYIFEQEKTAPAAQIFANWLLDSAAICVKGKIKSSSEQYKKIREILFQSYSELSGTLTNKKTRIKLFMFKYCPDIYKMFLKLYLEKK